jgi:hypothetical protein
VPELSLAEDRDMQAYRCRSEDAKGGDDGG